MCYQMRQLAVAVLLAFWPGAVTAEIPLLRIAGSGDQMPGAPPGEVFHELMRPQLEGDWIVAVGYSPTRQGFYAWDGTTLHVVADNETPLPGAPPDHRVDIFESSNQYDVGASGLVAFTNFLPGGAGAWAWRPDGLVKVAITGDPSANSSQPFYSGGRPVVVGDDIFIGGAEGTFPAVSAAIFRWNETSGLTRIVGPGFTFLGEVRVSASRVWFIAGLGASDFGIFSCAWDGSDLRLELDIDAGFPGSPTSRWSIPHVIGEPAAILALPDPPGPHPLYGLFHLTGTGGFETWLDQDDPEPTGGTWDRFGPGLAGSMDRVAFLVHDPIPQSSVTDMRLLVRDGDSTFRFVVAEGDTLNGQFLGLIEMLPNAMDGDKLALGLLRSNDSAVWVADLGPQPPNTLEVPTLGGWGVAALAAMLAAAGSFALRRRA